MQLVVRKVDVLVVLQTPAAAAAKQVTGAFHGARLMIDSPNPLLLEPNQTDGEIIIDDFPDEALEVAGSGTNGAITWTLSIQLIYCRFC